MPIETTIGTPVHRRGLRGIGRTPRPIPVTRAGRTILALPYDRLINGLLAICVMSGAVAFVEPSPYDLLLIVLMAVWVLGGFSVHRFVIPFAALIALYETGGFLALLPYLNEADPTTFMLQSLYLALSAIFFAVFFAQNTVERATICLQASAVAAVLASLFGIAGYFNLAGSGNDFTLYGRASSTFKDPNVFGSFLIPGELYLVQILILGRSRRVVTMMTGLLTILIGVLLSFSRGSWASLCVAALMVVVLCFITSSTARLRRRLVVMSVVAIAVAAIGLVLLLSIESVRTVFLDRFALAKDYDTGETGRFGNQLRAIPMLIERVNGFGPVRFRLFFDLDSHNSFLGAFSSYGWLGGSAYLLLVGLTTTIGIRQVLKPSPYRQVAQVFWPALFVLFAQGVQIDTDHWRQLYLLLGAVWGIETARIKWVERGRPIPATAPVRGPRASNDRQASFGLRSSEPDERSAPAHVTKSSALLETG